ncbi:hypothetical protein GH714_015318 [Hevea brasiliensis]|uniref:Uncharacterized protein n=1 Tax=Hevea brasiliensis TaxID=3981 RepID=A0A6A6LJJ1_HEVBR|nr:hypothetical protein GH714_015318 [Hevea brasiliensis]
MAFKNVRAVIMDGLRQKVHDDAEERDNVVEKEIKKCPPAQHQEDGAMAGSGGTKARQVKEPSGPNGRTVTQNVRLLNRCLGNRFMDDKRKRSYNSLVVGRSKSTATLLQWCPFIDDEFNCQKFGRPDTQYLKYAWQPDSCNLPRFNGVDFLMSWRGKKIMFVGDSLSLNMWESLSCMIHASVPTGKTTSVNQDSLHSVTFEAMQDYGVTLFMYRTPYLVDIAQESVGRMGLYDDGSGLYKDMNRLEAYYKGMSTWAKWVDLNVDPAKTRVFFQGISPTHYQGREWNQPKKNCYGEAEPLSGSAYPGGAPPAVAVLNKVLSTIEKPVYPLDITTLSQLRKDAHPSIYGEGSGTDCSHWCLPGLPDTWNQLLYAALIM